MDDIVNLLKKMKDNVAASIRVCMPGKIEDYDFKTQKASVKVDMQELYDNGITIDYPVIPSVPVVFMASGGAFITMPVNRGDTCMLIFVDRDMSNWLLGGGGQKPNSTRKHTLSDAIAIMGLSDYKQPARATNNTDVVVSYSGSVIIIKPDGVLNIQTTKEINITAAETINVNSKNTNITTTEDTNINAKNAKITAEENVDITAKNSNLTVTETANVTAKNIVVKASENITVEATENITINSKNSSITATENLSVTCKDVTITAGENVNINSKVISITTSEDLIVNCKNLSATVSENITANCQSANVTASNNISLQASDISLSASNINTTGTFTHSGSMSISSTLNVSSSLTSGSITSLGNITATGTITCIDITTATLPSIDAHVHVADTITTGPPIPGS